MQTLIVLPSFAMMLAFALPASPALGQRSATVLQLLDFLNTKQAKSMPDGALADRLSTVEMSEYVSGRALERLLADQQWGPKTAEQIGLLAEASVFSIPPASEVARISEPDTETQQKMLEAVLRFETEAFRGLPDFLATRVTVSYGNTPMAPPGRSGKRKAAMHWTGKSRREIAYRDGSEVSSTPDAAQAGALPGISSLTTWGEFGPLLRVILEDSRSGHMVWERWQTGSTGSAVAVFRFEVPRSASHYLVDFCCYQKFEDDPEEHSFRDRPAYHGELFVDPASGAIDHITLAAGLTDDDPVTASAIAVQYGRVSIGGKTYVCPVHGVAITKVHNRTIEAIDKIGIERHINIVEFAGYHKFGSTSRILPQ